MDDPFVVENSYTESELQVAAEFLTNWIPFLTRELCDHCSQSLIFRIHSLVPESPEEEEDSNRDNDVAAEPETGGGGGGEEEEEEEEAVATPKVATTKMSWADMAQEDELEDIEEGGGEDLRMENGRSSNSSNKGSKEKKVELSRERREQLRFMNITRKKDYICLERVKGKIRNVVDGLELHSGVFSSAEQIRIVNFVYELQEMGKKGELGEHTYSAPIKWMRGKGRVTIQFGCCYNYTVDKEGNPPGILQNIVADPLPPLLKMMVKRLVQWHILPPSSVPDSCIVNIYEPGDSIPPHLDSHDFVRPFCTASFLSECNILFGSNLKITGPGEFAGSMAIPLPVGSVLVLNGNGADLAKHCVPSVPSKRISITFRKMDVAKRPSSFKQEQDLLNIKPLAYKSEAAAPKSLSGDDTTNSVVVDGKALGRGKKYVVQGRYRSESASEDKLMVHEHEREKSSRKSSSHWPAKGNSSFGEAEGSAGRQTGQKPYFNSPLSDGRPSLLGTPNTQAPSSVRIVRTDDKRIVIRDFSDEEGLLDRTPGIGGFRSSEMNRGQGTSSSRSRRR